MGYPGRKYRQETDQYLPGQGYGQPSVPFPPQGQYGEVMSVPMGGHPGYGQPPNQNYNQYPNQPPVQNYNQYPNQPPVQNYNQPPNPNYNQFPNQPFQQQAMNQNYPMPGTMPGGMPMSGPGMPYPNPGAPMASPGMPMAGGFPQANNGYNAPPPYSNQAPFDHKAPFPHQTQMGYGQPPAFQPAPSSNPIPYEMGSSMNLSNFSGRKKAVLIGVNYFGTSAELRGCINDVHNLKDFICRHYGFSTQSMVILTDDQQDPSRIPTRANILQAMSWLVCDAKPNDSLFFHFSGHGSQVEDLDGDEEDGSDETICPVDFEVAGQIVDDEMNALMVRPLPQGCRLTAIFDCCHSGTALDLPYLYDTNGNLIAYAPQNSAKNVITDLTSNLMMGDMVGAFLSLKKGLKKSRKNPEKISQETRSSLADVVMFSG